jgi:hypothetical protein
MAARDQSQGPEDTQIRRDYQVSGQAAQENPQVRKEVSDFPKEAAI